MSPRRLLLIGEGPRDVGFPSESRRKVPCEFEGDLPRLARRLVHEHGGPEHFGYDAITIREVVSRIPRAGRATRGGSKGKDLRDAVVGQLRAQTPLGVIALIDARVDEVTGLRADVDSIMTECGDVPVVIGLAIQEVEVWMLADLNARVAAFGERVGTPPVAGTLEEVHDPKKHWLDRAGQLPPAAGTSPELHADQQRAAAWESFSSDTVARLCPGGFRPFRAAFRAFVERVFARGASP